MNHSSVEHTKPTHYHCINTHTFRDEEMILNRDYDGNWAWYCDTVTLAWEDFYEAEEADPDFKYNVPSRYCPYCMIKLPCDKILLDFALLRLGYTKLELFEVLKSEFKSVEDLYDVIEHHADKYPFIK
jgi:hypothetical protein